MLHEAKEREQETTRLKETALRTGKAEIEYIGDFLRRLHQFLLGEDGYFREHHSAWLVDAEIEFILGVPAAWSEPEQQEMVQAAVEAGIENPSHGSEPEAMAAIFFAQHETSLKVCSTPNKVHCGIILQVFRFVIGDAGGGTVVMPLLTALSEDTDIARTSLRTPSPS